MVGMIRLIKLRTELQYKYPNLFPGPSKLLFFHCTFQKISQIKILPVDANRLIKFPVGLDLSLMFSLSKVVENA